MKVAINGFGRIGRAVFKICMEKKINVVAINDIHGVEDAAYLLKHDSVYGNYKGSVLVKGNNLIVNGKEIKVLNEKDPEKLPWKKLGADIIIESTGVFRARKDFSKHIKAGAKKVIITAPSDDVDITIVPGVNDHILKKTHQYISVASCTTNASATVIKVLDDKFQIKEALLNTVHAYTSTQALVDISDKKPRRGRAAALNIVPTSTGASEAVTEVIPGLKGKLNGLSIRVPVADGSIVDITASLKKPFTAESVNNELKKASQGKFKGIIEYSTDELVSSDIIGNYHSAIVDSKLTLKEGSLIKVLAWYDNEYGYSSRVVDVINFLGKMK
ncbi:MAG: type I glyceraldehyde-3-phosphate dehydrogenase [Candidatus Pacearchaeota archaeon]